jgi:raffinose/stachyose/melibiose transport system substrate-binding protein
MTQHNSIRGRRWALLAIPVIGAVTLAGCSGSGGGGGDASTSAAAQSFTFSFPQANDAEDFYQTIAQQYMDETGVEIELLPVPGDQAASMMNTQLQAGNASDLLIVTPGAGQTNGVVRLAEAGLLAPLGEASAAVIPPTTEGLYTFDGEVYGQPTSLSANGLIWNPDVAASAGIDDYPESFDDLIAACGEARSAGLDFTVLAGTIPPNLGFIAQVISATRVYAADPDWNEQRAAGDVTFADSGWKQVLEDFVEMNDSGCFQEGAAGGNFDSITGGLIGGTALSASIPGSAATALSGASQGKYTLDVRPFPPAGSEDPWLIASPLFAWASNGKSDESVQLAVQEFLDWVAQPENSVEFANLSGSIPVAGAEDAELLPQYAPVGDLVSAGSYSPEPNLSWPNASVYDALSVGMQGLLTGQTNIDGILESMDAAWDE